MRLRFRLTLTLILVIFVAVPLAVQAAVVGRFTVAEGQVDLLKQGKIPARAAKVNDGVEPGDVIRTKSKAKAQVKFVDDSVVTMAPDSRIAVADFAFDAASGQRHAVLRFFKGVMHTVITRVLKMQEPDFLIETHTTVMGVRGSEAYTVQMPNATGIYSILGLWEVGPRNAPTQEKALLGANEFVVIPPFGRKQKITPELLQMLKRLMDTGLGDIARLGFITGPGMAGQPNIPDVLGFPGGMEQLQPVITPLLPAPVLTPPPVQPQQQRGPTGPSIVP